MNKTGLFARPNLKLFVVVAIAILALEQVISSFDTREHSLIIPAGWGATPPRDEDVQRLINQSIRDPSPENYLLVSDCLRRRGDIRQAMLYLRKAGLAAHLQEED